MRILIIGGDGMLGHQLLLSLQSRHEVRVTLRQDASAYEKYKLFNPANSYYGIDIRHAEDLLPVFADFQPQAVINAVGIVKQRALANDAIASLEINALFPHRLALLCKTINARMIHLSTDCVFSGKQGNYTEQDLSDAEDLYGKSKYLGEVSEEHCITLRTSIIGLELARKASLIEWFLAQTGKISGFQQAIYSGVTTLEMSRIIEFILMQQPNLSGLWHVASVPINKFTLLTLLTKMLGRTDIEIEANNQFKCDRSLNGNRFNQVSGYQIPDWNLLLDELSQQIKNRHRVNYAI